MQETVDASQVNEGAIVDDVANSSRYPIPNTQRSQELSPHLALIAILARRKIARITSFALTKPARGRDRVRLHE